MQHHGLQDYVMQDEFAMVHDRSMAATENLKAAKAAKVVAVKSDGTLSKLNLGRLNTALSALPIQLRKWRPVCSLLQLALMSYLLRWSSGSRR